MVYKCAAFGCKSGSKSNTDDSCVTFYAFPSDPQLREKWIKANPRKDFVVTKHSRLCSLHFHSSDFVDVRTDTNKSRAQQKSGTPLRRILKNGVVPSVFHNAPAYLSKSPGTRRGTKKTAASSRRADEARKLGCGGHRSEGFREKKQLRQKQLPVPGFCTELFNCVNYFNRA